ncbi:MAG: hypothetical protein HC869_20820 [Rhodospirillales bacterium]|nr:hypothetical protein [Rhodospirillales bacterium]
MRLTEDDLAIIRHIAKHRFLRSTHLIRLMPHRSYKKLVERLGALYHNGYLDRPRAQLDYYANRRLGADCVCAWQRRSSRPRRA